MVLQLKDGKQMEIVPNRDGSVTVKVGLTGGSLAQFVVTLDKMERKALKAAL